MHEHMRHLDSLNRIKKDPPVGDLAYWINSSLNTDYNDDSHTMMVHPNDVPKSGCETILILQYFILSNHKKTIGSSKQSYFYVGTEFDEVNFQWNWKTGEEGF